YWLGSIREYRGKIYADGEFTIDPLNVARLRYGIDLQEGRPTRAVVSTERDDVVVRLENFLPAEERRLFIAFGKDESPRPGRLPSVHRFRRELFTTIRGALDGLGIAIQ